jgi:hypothetical protein
LILPKVHYNAAALAHYGFVKDKNTFWHPQADLPRLRIEDVKVVSCAIMVESVSDFLLAHHVSLPIEGKPLSGYRRVRIAEGLSDLLVVERRGVRLYEPDTRDRAARYAAAVEMWVNRRRQFKNLGEGLSHAQAIARAMVKQLGTGMAAWAFLEAERKFWQTRNRAGQVQKARQDVLGLGWANHDHHTFRSSRPAFPGLIKILLTFGFKKRERYYAGADAGWGAQIMEQPEAKLTIFADVDLEPNEVSVDFSTFALPELDKPGTIGLWCALHGESILEAGMHHLEAKFDYEHLRAALKGNVNFMKPFSDFPHLRQAFSEGEIWKVASDRLEPLRIKGQISQEAYDRIKQNGAVGSHLENLQRRDGFKGFNQRGVSHIIREVNPERQALK